MPTVIVDRTGQCGGYHFEAGVEVELPDEVITALGTHVTVTGRKEVAQPVIEPIKEQAPKKDKMTRRAPKSKAIL